jgi:DNA mismatch endonuclease (patch repair protein)
MVQSAKGLTRSQMMARVGRRDTKPERMVRSAIHRAGFRFRLCRPDLPGRPDIVLPRFRSVIFVHGCFWHQHPGCGRATQPKSNVEFWERKLARNRERDTAAAVQLRASGWRVLIVWECELRIAGWQERLIDRLRQPEASAG